MTQIKLFIIAVVLLFSVGRVHAQSPKLDTARLTTLGAEVNNAMQNADYTKAAKLLKEMIALGMNNAETYFGAAAATGLKGDKKGAIAYLDTAAKKGWSDLGAWQMMVGSFSVGDDPVIKLASDLVKKNSASIAPDPKVVNPELHEIFLADQKERADLIASGDVEKISTETGMNLLRHDSLRRQQTYSLIAHNSLKTALDFYEAALVLQHGNDTADFLTAHQLALSAIKLGNEDAKWLAAATLDRYLVRQRKPQKYGTQSFTNKKTGKRELYPVDPSVTDEERAKWNVPPLANALKLVEKVYDKK